MRQFRVLLQPPAERDIGEIYNWLAQDDSDRADNWLGGVLESIRSLSKLPARCPLAPESAIFDREIRYLFHGKGRELYRVYFTIEQDRVHVLHVRHRARKPLGPDDL